MVPENSCKLQNNQINATCFTPNFKRIGNLNGKGSSSRLEEQTYNIS